MIAERNLLLQKRVTDHLVHGVVPPNVLARYNQFTLRRKNSRRMQSARRFKSFLRSAQLCRQREQNLDRNFQRLFHRGELLMHAFNGALAAKSAARRAKNMSRQSLQIERHVGRKKD